MKNVGFGMSSSSSTSVSVRSEPGAGFWHVVNRLEGAAGQRAGERDAVSPWQQGSSLFVQPSQQALLPPLCTVVLQSYCFTSSHPNITSVCSTSHPEVINTAGITAAFLIQCVYVRSCVQSNSKHTHIHSWIEIKKLAKSLLKGTLPLHCP